MGSFADKVVSNPMSPQIRVLDNAIPDRYHRSSFWNGACHRAASRIARGVFCCLRAELNAMGPGGSIVSPGKENALKSISTKSNTQVSAASIFGQTGSPGVSAYCASKAAVIGLSRTAAKENKDVRVNCVAPGECTPWLLVVRH